MMGAVGEERVPHTAFLWLWLWPSALPNLLCDLGGVAGPV